MVGSINARWLKLLVSITAAILFVCLNSNATRWLTSVATTLPTSRKSSSSSITLTPDGKTLLVVNPDSNSMTLVDTVTQEPIKEIPVGVDPRSVAVSPDGEWAYVANQGSNSLSVIDLKGQSVLHLLPVGNRPVGVAISPDGKSLAVAELGEDSVRLIEIPGLETRSLTPVADRPYGLAFTPDGRRLLITHLLSGDVTVLTVQPYKAYLPIVSWSLSTGELALAGYQHEDIYFQRTISTWPHVAPSPSVIVNSRGTRAYLPQTMANGLGLNQQFDTSVFPKVSVLNLESESHASTEHISLPETITPVGLPWDAALAREDHELWVVNASSNDVGVVDLNDPTHPTRTAYIPVGDNPRGIVISPDGGTAYVNNTLAGTVSVIDTAAYTVTQVITVTKIPLPPSLLHGKQLYFSSARPDLSRACWISCNTCHIEGEHDGRTWSVQYLGTVPPGEDPLLRRNTTSLLSMVETYPLRWSAEWDESADSEFSIRFEQFGTGLIEGDMHPPLGSPNQGRSYDLDCLALYLDSLSLPSRHYSLTPMEERGRLIFESSETGCADCHPAPLYSDLLVHDVGTADAYEEWAGPLIDTPTLRYLYDSAPYLHDGSALTLYEVLTTKNLDDEHGRTSSLSEEELWDLIAFLLILPYQP
jgi:YVTN family beta-propeller protein